jgi:hypothetical protein
MSGPFIVNRLPRQFASRDELDQMITDQLIALLSLEHRELLTRVLGGEADATQEMATALDDLIIEQTKILGWAITVCTLAQRRFSAWETATDGVERMQQFAAALVESARIMHGEKKPPLSSDTYVARQATIVELRLVLRQLQTRQKPRHHSFSLDEQVRMFCAAVTGNPYPYLNANLDSWTSFLQGRQRLLDESDHPAALFDAWLVWCTNLEPEQVRRKLSRLKPAQNQ